MNIVFETERLILRKFTLADTKIVYDLNCDPSVTLFTHDPMQNIEQAAEVLKNVILPQYDLYNHGRWAVHEKSGLEFIGWCGLKYRPELNEIDLGYRFIKEFWGNGYATEAALSSIQYGFRVFDHTVITGRAEHDNIGSWRVLEKCGMTYKGDDEVDGFPVKVYLIQNPKITAPNIPG